MRLAKLKFETKLQKFIRMGITIFKNFQFFIWADILSDRRSEIMFNLILRPCANRAVKLNFQPYICYQYAIHYGFIDLNI